MSSELETYVTIREIARFFKVSEEEVRSKVQFEMVTLPSGLEILSSRFYPRVSKLFFDKNKEELCLFTKDEVVQKLSNVFNKSEVIEKFLATNPPAIVTEELTGVSYYWISDLTSAYYDFVQDFKATLDFTIEAVAAELQVEPSQLFSLVKYMDLRLKPLVGEKSQRKTFIVPDKTYATVHAFLATFTKVELSKFERNRLISMGLKPVYVKGFGTFLENRVLAYLKGDVAEKTIVEEGISYLALEQFCNQLDLTSYELEPAILQGIVTVLHSIEYVKEELVEKVNQVKRDFGVDSKSALVHLLGFVSAEDLKSSVDSSVFKALYQKVRSLGLVSLPESSYKYLAEASKPDFAKRYNLALYSKDLFVNSLELFMRGIPLDKDYTGYLNTNRLLEFYNSTNSSEPLPFFLGKEGSQVVLKVNRKSYDSLISVSMSILLAPISAMSSSLLKSYLDWEKLEFQLVKKGVLRVLHE